MACTPVPGTAPQVWFNPLSLLADELGTDDPVFVWWFNVVGDTSGTYLIDTAQLCSAGPPPYDPMTAENIVADTPQTILYQWMLDVLFGQCCECA